MDDGVVTKALIVLLIFVIILSFLVLFVGRKLCNLSNLQDWVYLWNRLTDQIKRVFGNHIFQTQVNFFLTLGFFHLSYWLLFFNYLTPFYVLSFSVFIGLLAVTRIFIFFINIKLQWTLNISTIYYQNFQILWIYYALFHHEWIWQRLLIVLLMMYFNTFVMSIPTLNKLTNSYKFVAISRVVVVLYLLMWYMYVYSQVMGLPLSFSVGDQLPIPNTAVTNTRTLEILAFTTALLGMGTRLTHTLLKIPPTVLKTHPIYHSLVFLPVVITLGVAEYHLIELVTDNSLRNKNENILFNQRFNPALYKKPEDLAPPPPIVKYNPTNNTRR